MKNDRTVLIQCGDHFENQNRILPLALHFSLKGFCVYVMMYNKTQSSRLFECHKINTIYLNDYKDAVGVEDISNDDFIEISFVDRQKYPWKFYPSRINGEKEKIGKVVAALKTIVNEIKPEIIGIWNGHTGHVANSLRVLTKPNNRFFMERSLFERALFADVEGVNGDSTICKMDYASLECHSDKARAPIKSQGNDVKIINPARLVMGLNCSPFIFVPMQVQTDTNNILYSPYVKGMRRFLLAVLDAVIEFRKKHAIDLRVVVREHPEEVDPNLNLPSHELLYYSNESDVASWCKASAAVITINSTVGLEAICLGRPVICLGKSIYSGKDITLDVDFPGISGAIEKAVVESWVPEPSAVDQYLDYLCFYNSVNFSNFPMKLYCMDAMSEYNDESGSEVESNLYSAISARLNKEKLIRVGIFSKMIPKINLTYRNFKVGLSKRFIVDGLSKNLNIHSENIMIERIFNVEYFDNFDLIITPRSEIDVDFSYPIPVLDEYLLPIYGL